MRTREFSKSQGVEFTFGWYEQFLRCLLAWGYTDTNFERGIADGEMILRHDVDLSPRKALVMGQIEADLGLSSTYFFLVSSPLYNVLDAPNRRILSELVRLGHRVGVHFSTHQYWRTEPAIADLNRRCEENRSVLSVAAPTTCNAISFHCPPTWALNRTFPGMCTTYEPRFFSEIAYIADSGQRWREQEVIRKPLPDRLQVLTHPGLWGETDGQYIQRVTSETKIHLDRTKRYVNRELLDDRFETIGYPDADLSYETFQPI